MFSQFGLKELNVIQPHHCVQIVLVGVCQLNCACCFVRITLLSVMFPFVCLFLFLFCYFIVCLYFMLGPRKRDGSSRGVHHNE